MSIASHAAASPGVITFIEEYWWVLLFFGGGLLEWIGETFGVGASAIARAGKRRHRRRMERLELELQVAQARMPQVSREVPLPPVPSGALTKPGRCAHRRVKQVRDRDDALVAWLCEGCDRQLPADWAVAEEDL